MEIRTIATSIIKPERKNANIFRGHKLKELRIKANISQVTLGIKLGFSDIRGTISKFELNKVRPTQEVEEKLCEYFKVSKDYFRHDGTN